MTDLGDDEGSFGLQINSLTDFDGTADSPYQKMGKFGSISNFKGLGSQNHTASKNLSELYPNKTSNNSPVWKNRAMPQTPELSLNNEFGFNLNPLQSPGENWSKKKRL